MVQKSGSPAPVLPPIVTWRMLANPGSVEKAIELADKLAQVLMDLVEWSEIMGGFEARPWDQAHALADAIRDAA